MQITVLVQIRMPADMFLGAKTNFLYGKLAICFLLLCLVPGGLGQTKSANHSYNAESRLHTVLLTNYNLKIRPHLKINETVQASFGFVLRSLLYLNEKDENVEVLFYLLSSWHDARLSWNASEYSNILSTRFGIGSIWRPDFMPFTNVDESVAIQDSDAVVYSSGHVTWIPAMYLKSPCTVDLKTFPFDEQRCTFKFGSHSFHGNELNITIWGGDAKNALDTSQYVPNTNWALVGQSINIKVQTFSCCPDPYPQMEVVLAFQRNPTFYIHVFIIPAVLLGLLAPVSLLLPPESKERISLGCVVTLSIIFINTNLAEMLPTAHNNLPAISIYFTLILLWSVASQMCSILILNLHHRGPRRGKVPDSIRWLFLRSLRRLVCLGADSYYPLTDMEAISMRGLQPPTPNNTGSQEARGNANSRLEKDMEDVSRQLNHLTKRLAKKELGQEVLDEWHQVALVIDRTLFVLFLFIFLMCTIVLLA